MPGPRDTRARKAPRQDRSRETVEAILDATARSLVRQGFAGTTTNHVAALAGVSVGSLYQYYPNKAALLFRLHELESADTGALIDRILGDARRPPRKRLHAAVRGFFATEAAEAPLRRALALADVHFRASPEFAAIERGAVEQIRRFLCEAQPERSGRREFDARFVATVLSGVAESITSQGIEGRALAHWADACSAMLCAHLGLG